MVGACRAFQRFEMRGRTQYSGPSNCHWPDAERDMVSACVRRSGTRALGGSNGTHANTTFSQRSAKRHRSEVSALTPARRLGRAPSA
jgi:hypothetical protein